MLTPRFKITQTNENLTITIHAPYGNIRETEVYVDETDFRFSCTPYYLRLQLPGKVEEDDLSSGSYDSDKGDFILCLSKVNKGEHFENLEMITNLFVPTTKNKSIVIPNIEVIGNPSVTLADINESNCVDDSSQDNLVGNAMCLINFPKYGFANKLSGVLSAFEAAWMKEIIDLPSPDTTPEVERKSLREQRELNDFAEEHYMADFAEAEVVKPYITFTPEWETLQKDQVAFNVSEADLLKELPNKEYLLNAEDVEKLGFNLVDILYASCYNYRAMLGEDSPESSWNINKLSSTLCWFQNFTSLDEVVKACIRRSLCYPFIRNWELSLKVLEDVKSVLSLGRVYIAKRFCEIHRFFNNSYEPRYILNQFYIRDFLIWLQTVPDSVIESLRSSLSNIHPDKANMGLQLPEIEVAVRSVQEEHFVIENSIHKMTSNIKAMSLNNSEAKPQNVYHVNQKFFKCLLSSSSSSTSTDSDSDSSSSSSSSSSLDSDDLPEPQ